MIKLLRHYLNLSDRVTEWTGRLVSWLCVLLVLIICYDVIMRYLFNSSSVAIYELEWHVFSLIFLIGAGYALKYDKHVRVDVFYSRFSEKTKAWINLMGTLLFLCPFCLILITKGFDFVEHSWRFLESSPDPGGLPARYLIKAAIPVGIGLLFIQGLNLMCRSMLVLLDHQNPHTSGD